MSDLLALSEEQRLRLLISAVTDYAIYMLDSQGRVATWNPGAERFKGYTADEIIGQHFSRFYTDEDRDGGEPERALQTALNEGKYEREAWRVRKDGSLMWAHVLIDPVYDDNGVHVGFAKVTRDVTERKRSQDELEHTREALAQAQKMQALGELTGGIAHDFNNLMTVIAGASDFLLKNRDLPEEKKLKYLQAIVDTTDRARALTDHLLAFGRRQSLNPVVIDLAVRLDAFADLVGRMLGSLFTVTLDVQSKSPLDEVDAAQLETALLNDVVNARDAMPGGGELALLVFDCTLDSKDAVCISVRDSGSGIPEELLSRVFDPFFTTKEVGKGTGLGLSQIHGFAAQAGGAAEIESVPGAGTTLKILLPRTAKTLMAMTPDERPQSFPRGLKVLLVEDNAQVREFAAAMLADMDCDVETAANGSEGLEKALSGTWDLVFSDVVMPGMTGVQMAVAIREQRLELPILLATGFSDELLGENAGRFAVVRKPYDVPALAKGIAASIGEGAMRRAQAKI